MSDYGFIEKKKKLEMDVNQKYVLLDGYSTSISIIFCVLNELSLH